MGSWGFVVLGTVWLCKKRCFKCLWGVEMVERWGRWKVLGSVEGTKLSLLLPVLNPETDSNIFQLLLICSPLAYFVLRQKISVL